MQHGRSKATLTRGLCQPRFNRSTRLHPSILPQQPIQARGQHMHAVVLLAPAIRGIASDAERLANELIQPLAQIFVQHALERGVAPTRIMLTHDAHDELVPFQHFERSERDWERDAPHTDRAPGATP